MPFEMIKNKDAGKKNISTEFIGKKEAEKAHKFHESFPMYKETPLCRLKNLASCLGVSEIYVKDESFRFGLNAFKVLGGSYAIGNYIAEKLNKSIENLTYDEIISEETKNKIGKLTFISATDGNHGRGVAWTAARLNQKSVIYMPKGSAEERLSNIKKEGADASITDLNYDDAVRLADKNAEKNGWVLVQDTSWKGYEKIPLNIMKGYTTMALEIYNQLKGKKPTHIFLQAGVGSFASALTGFFADVYKDEKPVIIIVEPNEAACIYKTLNAADGKIHPVKGDMNTIMAGLACGEPVTVGIEVLRNYADYCISCDNFTAADGMRVLSSPLRGDERIISGESGAAGFGAFYQLMTDKSLKNLKEQLKIDENSSVLLISTEGDTDKENYKNITWKGAYSRENQI